jgi:alpha-beta hydrolase superfamily lysophospholipase
LLIVFVVSQSVFAIPASNEDPNAYYEQMKSINNAFFAPETYEPQTFNSPYLPPYNIKIAYDIIEPPDDSQPDYAIVILPGKGESYIRYAELMYDLENLTGNKIRFYLIDECGQGLSGRLKTNTVNGEYIDNFQRYEEDLLYFLQNIVHAKNGKDGNKTPLFLLAHSMGGGVATGFLEKYPGCFTGAILCSPMLKPLTIREH